MSGLISKINIKSYRGIDLLELKNLRQINILTGDNNSGKTSVLEVISTFCQPDIFRSWINVNREERLLGGISLYESMNDFFNVNCSEKKVEYVVETKNACIEVEMIAKDSETQITKKEYYNKLGYATLPEEDADSEDFLIVPETAFEIRVNGKQKDALVIAEGQRRMPLSLKKGEKGLSQNIIYIMPFAHAGARFFLNDILNNPELYQEILDVLKEFDPGILSINYDDGGTLGRGGYYKILSKENNRALPLDMYGDGMKKALLLMSAVVKAKDGILLLDEFETAIHTSAMERVFKWILETCCKLNVQVFLTTHSEEALNKVLNCSEQLKDEMAVYTLYKDREGNSVRRLDAKRAIDVKENMGLELR
ncbi:MAG: ATP/GTP-binding protein [Oliverpabstia sp.]